MAVEFQRDGSLALITISQPDGRNAVDGVAAGELSAAFDEVERDSAIRVAILAGGPRVFCIGADLTLPPEELLRPRSSPVDRAGYGFAGFVFRPRTKPVIAAVEGLAVGGGFELVLACDLAVSSRRARFSLPEVRRGLVAASGGAVRLPRQLPRKIALEMLLTGQSLSAERLAELGLVNRVVEPGQALAAARQLAALIIPGAPDAVAHTLAIAAAEEAAAVAAISAIQLNALEQLVRDGTVAEGIAALEERRPASWDATTAD